MNFLPNIVHLSLELQKRILGASSRGIHPRLIQVDSHAILFHFDANFLNFHGKFISLSHPNLYVSTLAKIGHFPCIGITLRGKCPETHVHMQLF